MFPNFPANWGRVVNSLMITQVVNGSEVLRAGVSLDFQNVESRDRQHPLCSQAKGFAEAKPSSRCFLCLSFSYMSALFCLSYASSNWHFEMQFLSKHKNWEKWFICSIDCPWGSYYVLFPRRSQWWLQGHLRPLLFPLTLFGILYTT